MWFAAISIDIGLNSRFDLASFSVGENRENLMRFPWKVFLGVLIAITAATLRAVVGGFGLWFASQKTSRERLELEPLA